MSLVVHLFVKDTLHSEGAILVLFIENNMMSHLKTK